MSDIDGDEAFDKLLDRYGSEAAEARHWRDRALTAEYSNSTLNDRVQKLEHENASFKEEARLAKHYLAEAEKKLGTPAHDPNDPGF